MTDAIIQSAARWSNEFLLSAEAASAAHFVHSRANSRYSRDVVIVGLRGKWDNLRRLKYWMSRGLKRARYC